MAALETLVKVVMALAVVVYVGYPLLRERWVEEETEMPEEMSDRYHQAGVRGAGPGISVCACGTRGRPMWQLWSSERGECQVLCCVWRSLGSSESVQTGRAVGFVRMRRLWGTVEVRSQALWILRCEGRLLG